MREVVGLTCGGAYPRALAHTFVPLVLGMVVFLVLRVLGMAAWLAPPPLVSAKMA